MNTLPRYLRAQLADPANTFATSWGWTALFALVTLLTSVVWPFGTGIMLVLSVICICEIWSAYYADLIDSAHLPQHRKSIGPRALLIHVRLAVAGTLALIGILSAFTLATGAGLWSRPVAMVCGTCIAALPLWFVSDWVKVCLLSALQQVMNLPFQLTFMVLGATHDTSLLSQRHAELNGLSCRLFTAVTGYESNLNFLMKTEDLLYRLPTQRPGAARIV